MSNASISHQGTGEALGWFSLVEPGDVDEIRINAGGGEPYKEWQLASQPVQLRWTAATAADASPPQWVSDLRAIEEAQRRADAERRASEPVSGGDVAFFSGFMLLVLALGVGGIVVPVWSAWKWQGVWRVMALVPVCIIAFVVLRIIVDTTRDPTSHNLWPFEIIMFGGLALGIIAVLKLVRRWVGVQA